MSLISLNQRSCFPGEVVTFTLHVSWKGPKQPGGRDPAQGLCRTAARLLGSFQPRAQGSGEEDSPAQPCHSALSHSQGYVAPLTHCWCPGGWQKRTTLTVLPRGTSVGHGGVPARPWLHHSTSQPQQGCVTGWSREEMIQVQDGAAVVLPAQQHESKEGCKEL